MPLGETLALAAVALGTSALTATVGLGGGVVLIAVMLMFLPPALAIPFHGALGLAANATRVTLLRDAVAWPLVWRFALLLPPGAALGMMLFQGLSERTIQVLIGLVVLATLYRGPAAAAVAQRPRWWFLPLGFVTGALAVTVGAVGMLVGPFLLRRELRKEGVHASMAMMVSLAHLVKIVAFGAVGFPFRDMAGPLLVLVPAVVVGTWVGRRLLAHFSERWFVLAFRGTLVALALKLVVWEGVVEPLL